MLIKHGVSDCVQSTGKPQRSDRTVNMTTVSNYMKQHIYQTNRGWHMQIVIDFTLLRIFMIRLMNCS